VISIPYNCSTATNPPYIAHNTTKFVEKTRGTLFSNVDAEYIKTDASFYISVTPLCRSAIWYSRSKPTVTVRPSFLDDSYARPLRKLSPTRRRPVVVDVFKTDVTAENKSPSVRHQHERTWPGCNNFTHVTWADAQLCVNDIGTPPVDIRRFVIVVRKFRSVSCPLVIGFCF